MTGQIEVTIIQHKANSLRLKKAGNKFGLSHNQPNPSFR